MRYPIDAEKYITAMRLEFGQSLAAEEAHREIIPTINKCYEDGLHGKSGYPLRLALVETMGKDLDKIKSNPLLPPLITWCNQAYEQGRREASGA